MNNYRVIIPNKYKNKFFGVDFFANVCNGSDSSFKYYASSIDELMIFQNEEVGFSAQKFEIFKYEVANLEDKGIIGFFQNPDIYDCIDSIKIILDELSKNELGLFIESSSENILNDLELLKDFSSKLPLLVAIPISSYSEMSLSFFSKDRNLEAKSKLIHKLVDSGINVGLIYKPLIPRINDDLSDMEKIINKVDTLNVKFIYPSFTLYFDSFKIKNFYDIINKEKPELKNYYFDNYGFKYSWESQNLEQLKRFFVFASKKSKIKFAMKDIISLYKDEDFTQLKLF